MKDPLFIAYANLPLFDDPLQLFSLPDLESLMAPLRLEFEDIIQAMAGFTALHRGEEIGASGDIENRGHFEHMAYEAVYGYVSVDCEDCFAYEQPKTSAGGDGHAKCHECQQSYFRRLLSQIIEPSDDLSGLSNYATPAKLIVHQYLFYDEDQPGIVLDHALDIDQFFLNAPWPREKAPYFDRFNFFIRGIVGFDLLHFLHFLRHSNKDLIKRCPVCDRFFIGARASKTYCSDKCRFDFHNNTEKARRGKRSYWHAHKHELT